MLDKTKNKGDPKPYLRNFNVRWFDFDLSDVQEMRFQKEEQDRYSVVKGDLVICEGGYPGRAAIWDQDESVYFQKALHRVRFHEPARARWLLYYLYMKDLDGSLKSHFNGTGIQHFTGEALAQFKMPLPPLADQRRIVAILDEAFDGIAAAKANAEKNLQNARAIFESQLQFVFSQRGDGWLEKRLGDVVTRLTNGYVGPTRNIYCDSGVPYLLARHVKNNRLMFDRRTFISDVFNQKHRKSMLKVGDVLLVQSGHIGHSAVVPKEHEGHNCHAMIVISPIESAASGSFLSLYFNSPEMRRRFEKIRSGSTVPHLTCKEVKELRIALPDLAIQLCVVKNAEDLQKNTERLEFIYERKIAALDALKQSLLHRAFAGELTADKMSELIEAVA